MQFCDYHTSNEACEGIKLEKPGAPEAGDLWIWDRNAAEESEGYD
jgi:hypothetical protein